MRPTWIDHLKARFTAAVLVARKARPHLASARQAAYVVERLKNNRLI